jgi:hypothetical protein
MSGKESKPNITRSPMAVLCFALAVGGVLYSVQAAEDGTYDQYQGECRMPLTMLSSVIAPLLPAR